MGNDMTVDDSALSEWLETSSKTNSINYDTYREASQRQCFQSTSRITVIINTEPIRTQSVHAF